MGIKPRLLADDNFFFDETIWILADIILRGPYYDDKYINWVNGFLTNYDPDL